ncbi:MAG: hypothetical protein BWZ00_01169 [Bacteroidetes bacterium ADurb.BinA174]|nr:MAG: hypothetical protein BWZ00_01169 [Bacteroidetes bacterium ADurb.BinA174]
MKIIYSKYLPVKGFRAINLFGVVFARKEQGELSRQIINHELIHTRQMLELMFIGFYVWYVTEWIIKWIIYKNRFMAYRNIGFEREAFENDDNFDYLKHRKWYGFANYV